MGFWFLIQGVGMGGQDSGFVPSVSILWYGTAKYCQIHSIGKPGLIVR
jgi:hypothetical protein